MYKWKNNGLTQRGRKHQEFPPLPLADLLHETYATTTTQNGEINYSVFQRKWLHQTGYDNP